MIDIVQFSVDNNLLVYVFFLKKRLADIMFLVTRLWVCLWFGYKSIIK